MAVHDPNAVYRMLVEIFTVVSGAEKAKEMAGEFWKRIYIDAVLSLAEKDERLDKGKMEEIAKKGNMTDLLLAAIESVPAEEIEEQVRGVASNYSRILWEELMWNLPEEKKQQIRDIWKKYGLKIKITGLREKPEKSPDETQEKMEVEGDKEALMLEEGDEGLLEAGDEEEKDELLSDEQELDGNALLKQHLDEMMNSNENGEEI